MNSKLFWAVITLEHFCENWIFSPLELRMSEILPVLNEILKKELILDKQVLFWVSQFWKQFSQMSNMSCHLWDQGKQMASLSLTSLSFLVRNQRVSYLIVGLKGIICFFFHSMSRWMCLTGSALEDSSCFINQTGLQPALQIDPWDIICCSGNCSSYYLVAATTMLTHQLTPCLVIGLKMLPCTKSLWLTECYCYTGFFLVFLSLHKLKYRSHKEEKRQLGKWNTRLHECGICWVPVVREATQ